MSNFINKLDILAVGVHPDDVELGCGGILAKEISKGKKVGVLDLTAGELGTRGNRDIRINESNKASNILKLTLRENLFLEDGFFKEDDYSTQIKIINVIRKYKPNIIISNSPNDRHPDHGRASNLITKCIFLSGLIKIKTDYEFWKVKHNFHYIQWMPLKPHFIYDITGFLEKKIEASLAYKSQFYSSKSNEPETPISSKNFIELLKYRALDLGRLIGVEEGEGLLVNGYLGMNSLDFLV